MGLAVHESPGCNNTRNVPLSAIDPKKSWKNLLNGDSAFLGDSAAQEVRCFDSIGWHQACVFLMSFYSLHLYFEQIVHTNTCFSPPPPSLPTPNAFFVSRQYHSVANVAVETDRN